MSKQKERIKEFFRLTQPELETLVREKKERLRQLRFDLVAGKVKNVREVREAKKDIARINTLIREDKLKTKSERQ